MTTASSPAALPAPALPAARAAARAARDPPFHRPPIRRVLVVVAACEDEDRIGQALDSIQLARDALAPMVTAIIVVVADSCTDGTVPIAIEQLDHSTDLLVETAVRSVGAARRAGVEAGLARLHGVELGALWIANADADSIVASSWLQFQIDCADSGFDAVAGTATRAHDGSRDTGLRCSFDRSCAAGAAASYPHVHGCNLGLRGSIYHEVVGWRRPQTDEDNDIWRCLTLHGTVLSTNANAVATGAPREKAVPKAITSAIAKLIRN